jgi:Tfp pilus assembly protein PilX
MNSFVTRIRRRSRAAAQEGFALVAVMLASMALMALGVAIVEYGVGSQFLSKRDQNWNAALAAANAGVNDYLYRINNQSNYATLYGTSGGQTKDTANPAMTATTTTGADWAAVPGAPTSKFRYWVDSAANQDSLARSGSVDLTVTGKVGNAARTLEVSLRVATYLDFLYYTDLEISDPLINSQSSWCAAPRHAYTQGSLTGYDVDGDNDHNCSLIYFYGQGPLQDVINGPLHSNDRIRICGSPQFKGPASTSYPGYQPASNKPVKPGHTLWQGRSGCSNSPSFLANPNTSNLVYADQIPPLPSNSALETYTGGTTGGCRYEGPTSITFNSNGTMTVWSPTTSSLSPGCPGGIGTGSSPQTGSLPSNGVIYVRTADNTRTNDPGDCLTNSGSLRSGNRIGYPISNDVTSYNCLAGDVFVKGALNGQVTIGGANDIVVVDDLTYHDKPLGSTSYQGSDILGLIANRFVSVYHPVRSNGNELTGYLSDPEINAAILSVQHSFYVQQYNRGDADLLGDLTVFGAIAQQYRGPVGTFGCGGGDEQCTGYLKNYNYDNRLKYLEPPYFLNPTDTAFQQSTWRELQPRLS